MGGETQLYSQHWHTPNINYYRCFSIQKMKMWNGRHIFLFYWFSVFKTKYFLSPRIHKFKMTNFTDILGIYNPEVLLHTDLGPQTFDQKLESTNNILQRYTHLHTHYSQCRHQRSYPQKQHRAERGNSFDFLMSSIGDTQSCCCTTRVVTQYIGKFYFPLKKTVGNSKGLSEKRIVMQF